MDNRINWAAACLAAVLCLPAAASAAPPPTPSLGLPAPGGVGLKLALADEQPARDQPPAGDPALDFDILGAAPPAATMVEDGRLRWRRGLLTGHQTSGFALLAFDLAATVVGQLNYNDRFVSGDGTARYETSHAVLAWATVGTFVATGTLALLAPAPPQRLAEGFDRLSLHKLCMGTAAAGMVAQAVLGMVTAGHEGRLDQNDLATVHLVLGYATFAAIATGFGALVF